MWRDKLLEIKKEKGVTTKLWSEASGVSVDTINRVMNSKKVKTDAPRIDTIEDLCAGLGVEVWEIFYLGDKSLVSLQAEINSLKAERDTLVADNAVQKEKIEEFRNKVDALKDEIIAVHNYYIKRENNV